ncbi:MAG TPA: formate--tetrahydrofolate ligase [Kofleriaceae bacterium]|nr:formate--tetrahydrofolate ligase [Kofleriaceae bacterium]
MHPISDVAARLGLDPDHLHPYGKHFAKVDAGAMEVPRSRPEPGRLVLVSAITPTPAGEGKTTTSIGLADALSQAGESVCLALREPSLGPCFGLKGGGTGGGRAQLAPADRINLHFTGDFHAITSAHNLLAAAIDNALHFDNEPGGGLDLEPRRMLWRRVIDMNDRALRNITVGLGGPAHGVPRQCGFDITAASELMAMLCLTTNVDDLHLRIERTLVGFTRTGKPVTAGQLGVTGAMLALLRDALLPNLAQTLEGTPALVHGGPFANIAHGCNSVLATRLGLHLADWVVTEAGFGFDLGAEKFFDIKCRSAGLDTAAVVLVATVRALKMHGGARLDQLGTPDPDAVRRGLPNLEKHIESIGHFGKTPIIAVNRFAQDAAEELAVLREFADQRGLALAMCEHFVHGGEGAAELAKHVVRLGREPHAPFRPLYELHMPVHEKIRQVAKQMYGASDVDFTKAAERDLAEIDRLGYGDLPVCVAKTQSSLSDDPKLRGRPHGFEVTVRNIQINAGAGFLVVLTGDILRMPGLPRKPQALAIDLIDGEITGLR